MELPRGACTVVDFAYAVHTDVGNTCVAARIDHQMSPLGSKLYNGQTIEIICSESSRPHPSWLDFVHTAKARTNIRHFLKSLQKTEAISLGKRLLQRSINQLKGTEVAITGKLLKKVLDQYHLQDEEDLLAEIGLGNRNSSLVAKAIFDVEEDITAFDDSGKPLAIKGTEGMVVSFAKCCRPVPGDAIAGFMSSGKGIVIHQRDCPNITERSKEDRQLSVQWSEHVEGEFLAYMRVQVANQRGVLATLAATIANMSSNIEHVHLTEKDGASRPSSSVVTVQDRIHLARIMKKLRSLGVVNRICANRLCRFLERLIIAVFTWRGTMAKSIINTDAAPQAIGTYSQAVKVDNTVYIPARFPSIPPAWRSSEGGIEAEITARVRQPEAVAEAAGGSLADVVKLNIFLVDLGNFPTVNEIMARYFASLTRRARRSAWRRCPRASGSKWTRYWFSSNHPCPAARRGRDGTLVVTGAALLKGVGPKVAEKLARLGLQRQRDLLFHLPLRYEDRTFVTPLGSLQPAHASRWRPRCCRPACSFAASAARAACWSRNWPTTPAC